MKSTTQSKLMKLEDLRPYVHKCVPSQVVETWTVFVNLNQSTYRQDIESVRKEGAEALSRLLPIAMRDTGQSSVIAGFLLGLYNGPRFPFDMTRFRRLDHNLFLDCLSVLMMDSCPAKEVHDYFERGGQIWEQMAEDWRLNQAE